MGKEVLHFATCFSAKQTTENGKEVLRLAFCDVLRRNKHALSLFWRRNHVWFLFCFWGMYLVLIVNLTDWGPQDMNLLLKNWKSDVHHFKCGKYYFSLKLPSGFLYELCVMEMVINAVIAMMSWQCVAFIFYILLLYFVPCSIFTSSPSCSNYTFICSIAHNFILMPFRQWKLTMEIFM